MHGAFSLVPKGVEIGCYFVCMRKSLLKNYGKMMFDMALN